MADYASGAETRATALRCFTSRRIDPGQSQAACFQPNTVSTSSMEAF
jgi:hypothetical protein